MTEAYYKTFWKNSNGIEAPIPLEEWPTEAKFLTVDKDGWMSYWSAEPDYDPYFNCWWSYPYGARVKEEQAEIIGGAHYIWKRPS